MCGYSHARLVCTASTVAESHLLDLTYWPYTSIMAINEQVRFGENDTVKYFSFWRRLTSLNTH